MFYIPDYSRRINNNVLKQISTVNNPLFDCPLAVSHHQYKRGQFECCKVKIMFQSETSTGSLFGYKRVDDAFDQSTDEQNNYCCDGGSTVNKKAKRADSAISH